MSENNDQHALSSVEAARQIGVSPQTLTRWAAKGEGPKYVIVNGRRRYSSTGLKKWLEGQ